MKKSIKDTRLLNRAFVSFDGVNSGSIHFQDPKIIYWRFHIIWKNTGNTPTKKLRIHTNYELRDTPIPDNFDFKDYNNPLEKYASCIIAPKSTIVSQGFDVLGEEIFKVREGQKYLYLWGWAEYRNIFDSKKLHISRFCVKVTDIINDPRLHYSDVDNRVIFNYSNHSKNNDFEEVV